MMRPSEFIFSIITRPDQIFETLTACRLRQTLSNEGAANEVGLPPVLVAMMEVENSIVPVAGFGTHAVSAGPPSMRRIVVVVLSVFLSLFF
jgi:hypothetical protein